MTSSKKKFVAVLIAVSATLGMSAGLAGTAQAASAAKPDCAVGGLLGGGGGC